MSAEATADLHRALAIVSFAFPESGRVIAAALKEGERDSRRLKWFLRQGQRVRFPGQKGYFARFDFVLSDDEAATARGAVDARIGDSRGQR